MIRVVLPQHLRTLARVDGEVQLDVEGVVTQRSVLDALEARYPMLTRNHPRPRHAEAPAVREVLRLRGGPVPRAAGLPAARRRRDRGRAFLGGRGDCGWVAYCVAGDGTCSAALSGRRNAGLKPGATSGSRPAEIANSFATLPPPAREY